MDAGKHGYPLPESGHISGTASGYTVKPLVVFEVQCCPHKGNIEEENNSYVVFKLISRNQPVGK
jgi:hypothetical protein